MAELWLQPPPVCAAIVAEGSTATSLLGETGPSLAPPAKQCSEMLAGFAPSRCMSEKQVPLLQSAHHVGDWVRYQGWEDPLKEGMATHSRDLAERRAGV